MIRYISMCLFATALHAQADSSFDQQVPSANSGPIKIWTLDECIEYALEHNIDIKRKILSAEEKRIDLSLTQWSYAPSISAGISYNLSSGRILDETTYNFIENETAGSSSASVSGNLDVFSGFQKLHRLKYARIDLKAALADIEVARHDLKMNVTVYYLEMLCAKENIAALEQLVSNLQIQEEKTAAKMSSGKITGADLLQIRAQIYNATNDVFSANSAYESAKIDLCQLLEINDYTNFEITPPEDIPIEYYKTNDFDKAVDNHPNVQSAELYLELAKRDLKIARTYTWPSISLSAGYGSNHSDARQKVMQNKDGTFRYESYPFFRQYADNSSCFLSISLNIPIFTGLSVRKNILRKKISIKESEYALISAKKSAEKTLIHTWTDVQTAWKKYQGAIEQVKYTEESARQLTIKYESGATDILSYLTAVTELAKARHDLNSEKYTYIMKARLLDLLIISGNRVLNEEVAGI